MNHFKLVHGTTAPTRYTKIVFVLGKGTKFVKQYQEVEYVSRYTKLAAPPASWTPPAPDPVEDLVWVNKSSTTGSTVLGSVLTGNPGTTTGGAPPVVVVSQWQRSETTSGFTGFTPWTELGSAPVTYTTTVDDSGMYVRLATKATDGDGTVYYGSGNSVGPIEAGAAPLSIVQNAKWESTNVYEVGQNIESTTATFAGGVEPITYRYRYQYKKVSSDPWANSPWVVTTNGSNLISLPLTETGIVKFQCQAKDATNTSLDNSKGDIIPILYAPLYSLTPERTVVEPLSVGNVTKISNGSFVNPTEVYSFQNITPIPATFSGGYGTLVIETRLQKYSGSTAEYVNINDFTTTPATVNVNGLEPGTKLRAQTRATDSDGVTVISNSSATPSVGITTTIGTVTITPEPTAIGAGLSQIFNSVITGGTATDFSYQWSVRSGSAQLMSNNNISDEALYRFDDPGTTQIQLYVSDPSASNSPQSFVATIVVS